MSSSLPSWATQRLSLAYIFFLKKIIRGLFKKKKKLKPKVKWHPGLIFPLPSGTTPTSWPLPLLSAPPQASNDLWAYSLSDPPSTTGQKPSTGPLLSAHSLSTSLSLSQIPLSLICPDSNAHRQLPPAHRDSVLMHSRRAASIPFSASLLANC